MRNRLEDGWSNQLVGTLHELCNTLTKANENLTDEAIVFMRCSTRRRNALRNAIGHAQYLSAKALEMAVAADPVAE